jgi:hypothetical protein
MLEQSSLEAHGREDHEPHRHRGAAEPGHQPREAARDAIEHDQTILEARELERERSEEQPDEGVR